MTSMERVFVNNHVTHRDPQAWTSSESDCGFCSGATRWWFQLIWKILVRTGSSSLNRANFLEKWNHHLSTTRIVAYFNLTYIRVAQSPNPKTILAKPPSHIDQVEGTPNYTTNPPQLAAKNTAEQNCHSHNRIPKSSWRPKILSTYKKGCVDNG